MKIALLVFGVLSSVVAHGQKKEGILIAAASDLKFALDSIVVTYTTRHPAVSIKVSYGSSGKLFEQISNGAPFDVYFSADVIYPRKLHAKGLCLTEIYTYGYGRLVLWSAKYDPSKRGMSLLSDPEVRKVAIANPLHAPYGRAALEALRSGNVYEEVRGKLVYGENISQAAQFVTSGAAEAGIIALALATSPAMKTQRGSYYLIPQGHHTPLEQAFVVLKRADGKESVTDFVEFVNSARAKDILAYFGFSKQP